MSRESVRRRNHDVVVFTVTALPRGRKSVQIRRRGPWGGGPYNHCHDLSPGPFSFGAYSQHSAYKKPASRRVHHSAAPARAYRQPLQPLLPHCSYWNWFDTVSSYRDKENRVTVAGARLSSPSLPNTSTQPQITFLLIFNTRKVNTDTAESNPRYSVVPAHTFRRW
jgi:hypothetical protein